MQKPYNSGQGEKKELPEALDAEREEEIEEELAEIKELVSSDLPPEEKEERIQSILVRRQQFSGPLPPPNILAEYDKIVPGAAEEIIRMSSEQRRHTMGIEKSLAESEINRVRRALDLAEKSNTRGTWLVVFIVGVALLSIILKAHPSVSIAFLGLPIVMALKHLLYEHNNRDNSEENDE